jgi:hypothetical protein
MYSAFEQLNGMSGVFIFEMLLQIIFDESLPLTIGQNVCSA